jgi:hypothetical protein
MSWQAIAQTDQSTAADAVEAKRARHRRLWLPGIGSDDLQVGLRAKREQRIVGAQTYVPATRLGPYAKAFLQIGHGAGQIGGPVDEMIDQHDLIIPRTHSHRTGPDRTGPDRTGPFRLMPAG